MRHLRQRFAAVKTQTVASKKLAYTSWLSHENVAWDIGAAASRWTHWKERVRIVANMVVRVRRTKGGLTCLTHSNFVASYIASWVSWTTKKWIWSWWNCTLVSDCTDALPAGSCRNLDFCFSHPSELHTKSLKQSSMYKLKPHEIENHKSNATISMKKNIPTCASAPDETSTFSTWEKARPVILLECPFSLLLTYAQ